MSTDHDLALARVEADLHQARETLLLSVSELQREVARSLDWREWIYRKPHLSMGLAFGAGLLLGRRRG
jgi:hypothetical protein